MGLYSCDLQIYETSPFGAKQLAEIPKLVFADNGDDEQSIISISVFNDNEKKKTKKQEEKEEKALIECKICFLILKMATENGN